MALDLDCNTTVYYTGNDVQFDFLYNFEQLQYAIEDNRCIIEGGLGASNEKYWRKADETIYSTDTWIKSDDYVATTAAIDDRIDEKNVDIINDIEDINDEINSIKDDITDINTNINNINIEINDIKDDITDINTEIGEINTDLSDKVDKLQGYTDEDIDEGEYTSDATHFAYTDALTRLYDVTFLAEGQSAPDGRIKYIHPGKWLITSTNQLFMWNGSSWFMPIAGGGGGGGGGAHTTIRTTNPINQSYNSASNEYSLTFNINSLVNFNTLRRR